MRKFAFGLIATLALAFAGALAWKAEAFPLIPPVTKSSPVENIACGGPGRCPPGTSLVLRTTWTVSVRTMRRLLWAPCLSPLRLSSVRASVPLALLGKA